MLTGLAATAGFALATLIITPLASLTGAVTAKRQLACSIWDLGHSPIEVVRTAWNGERFDGLDQQLLSLTPQINSVAEQHLAFPCCTTFAPHDVVRRLARDRHAPRGVGPHGRIVHPDVRLPALIARQAQAAIDGYLDSFPTNSRGARRRPARHRSRRRSGRSRHSRYAATPPANRTAPRPPRRGHDQHDDRQGRPHARVVAVAVLARPIDEEVGLVAGRD